ncbi:MAG: hypothetical protein AUG51_16015 [Acidobacteria bacterium 13_1_20CM_3_53_8]|nr:MAG: hypothetical protein AUG51_16015 [Acidobacteria bacterium 13_1_20CM_3_53_8]
MRAFLDQHRRVPSRHIILYLSIGFGNRWIFEAVEILPGNEKLLQMLGFHRHADVERDDTSPYLLTNPPVVPLWIDPLMMQINIECWLEEMIGNPDTGWQRHWFPDSRQIWQLSILEEICQYYQHRKRTPDSVATTAFRTVEWGLKLSLLTYLMSHALLVPEDDIDILFGQLRNPFFKGQPRQEMVCPRAANKYVKMMALPVMRMATQQTLSGLQELFRKNVAHAVIWDDIFAVVFLLLMSAGSTQRSLIQRAIVCAVSKENALGEAQAMNHELVDYVIHMFHDKFRTGSKSKSFNPLRRNSGAAQSPLSPFAARVKNATDRYCESFSILMHEHWPGLTQVKIT